MTKLRPWSLAGPAGAAALGLLLGACELGAGSGNDADGQALADAPVAGTLTLNDSSLPMQTRSAETAADGTYAVKVAGLVTPYLLRVAWEAPGAVRVLYGVAEGNENVDVNGLTDLAWGGACAGLDEDAVFWSSDASQKRATAQRARAQSELLGALVAPLLGRYGLTAALADRDAVRRLLQDVGAGRADGLAILTNRATGGVIFQGPLDDLAAGTFHPEAMPDGPAGQACTAFTYAPWGACRPDGTQERAALASRPPGCVGGVPETVQPCAYLPPVPTCASFTYSDYGACQPDGTRVRAVLASLPAGCAGGEPVTVQACPYVPPAPTCVEFGYSAWGACRPDGSQARAVLTSLPAGCTGGAPITTRACTYQPPLDGAALYAKHCAGCHGNRKKGSSVRSIARAIDRDTGGMGALEDLTAAEIAAISAAP